MAKEKNKEVTQQEAQADADLNAAEVQAENVAADREALEAAREQEQAEREEKTAKTDRAGADALRQKVYDVADKASGTAVQPLSNEGAPLTVFEQESQRFFGAQNELEAQIDAIEVDPNQQQVFAGTDVNVLQAAGSELGPVGSATVTTYVGETIHPYPPTDYNAAAINEATNGDLTADPILAEMGLEEGDPMPPENNVHDIRETDGRADTKDFMRRQRAVLFPIDETRRAKYPAGVEAPV